MHAYLLGICAALHGQPAHHEYHAPAKAAETVIVGNRWIDAQKSPPPEGEEVRARWLDGVEGIAFRVEGRQYALQDNTFTSCVMEWRPLTNKEKATPWKPKTLFRWFENGVQMCVDAIGYRVVG